ncbi:MBL fold metallo-hydrolase [uncultured Psychroserpens sp.]|uniref:MBL fold metallo-hydrolase n=1 Tax=uncultured Psychroserpens sp. TaxID=255436 RepID=UPI0026072180|nr:MBL fold metallo-hydrolase [uncultured Psychroserpens sp.]
MKKGTKEKIKVEFIDVGQGDCIVLNWTKDEGSPGLGIVDCANFDKSRLYFENKAIKEIDFLVLSHPHSDHFYGMRRLLEFFKEQEIVVKEIWITFLFARAFLNGENGISQKDFIKGAVKDVYLLDELCALMAEIDRRHNAKESILKFAFEDKTISLNSEYQLKVLAPDIVESTQSFIDFTFTPKTRKLKKTLKNDLTQNPDANLLSSCLLLLSKQGNVLLTSDLTSKEKKRIFEKHIVNLDDLQLMQVPHHGSLNGFCKTCLNQMPYKQDCIAVISVGSNNYGHPKDEVVKYYNLNFKNLHLTGDCIDSNKVENQFFNEESSLAELVDCLDLNDIIGLESLETTYKGAKSFTISNGNCNDG